MTKKKKKRLNKRKIISLIFSLIFIVIICISSVKIIKYLSDNKENRHIQKTTSKAISVIPDTENKYRIDFETLKKQNEDAVAYIKVKGTKINYIVVKGNDNLYYLDHNFNKESNVSGWIFADYHNKFNGKDKNIILYGHNTWDGSMFGSLRNIFDADWYNNKDNHKILFVTEEGTSYYEVFSTYLIEPENYYITTDFNNDTEYENFIKSLKFRSLNTFDVDVNKDDKILTLSTCSGDGKKRIVLHAKKIDV